MNPILMNMPAGKKKANLIAVLFGVVGMIFFSSVNATVLPVAALEIGGTEIYPMVNTVCGVFGVIFMPLFGYMCYKNPSLKYKLFSVSVLIAAVGRVLAALSGSMVFMIVVSVLMAPMSAGIFVCGYAIISDLYEPEKAGTYLGACGICMSLGMLAAPLIGGVLTERVSWRAVYWVNAVLLLVPVAVSFMGIRLTKEEKESMMRESGSFDFLGMTGTVLFLAGVVLILSLCTSSMPFGSPLNTVCIIASVAGLLMLGFSVRKRGEGAFIPAPVLKDRNTLFFTLANITQNFSAMSIFFFMPTYVLYVLNGTATQASIPITAFSIIGLFTGAYFGKMIGKSGTARGVGIIAGIDKLIVFFGFAIFLNPNSSLWFVYIMMFIGGIFNSAAAVSFSAGPQVQLRPEVRVSGNSIIQMGQNFGSLIGTAVYTLIISMMGVAAGMKVALYLAGAVSIVSLLCYLPLQTLAQQGVKAEQ